MGNNIAIKKIMAITTNIIIKIIIVIETIKTMKIVISIKIIIVIKTIYYNYLKILFIVLKLNWILKNLFLMSFFSFI